MNKLSLISLSTMLIFAISCGGGGGGNSSSIFNFNGFWYAYLIKGIDSCNLAPEGNQGNLDVLISQANDSITAQTLVGTYQGKVTSNSFLTSNDQFNFIRCPDGSYPTNVTTTLVFNDASGDSTNSVVLSGYGTCPGFTEQCELSFGGTATRVSGQGGTSLDNDVIFDSANTPDPLF